MTVEGQSTGLRYSKGRILVFARAPYAGQVKRRLIPAYGKRGSTQLYRLMLLDTLRTMSGFAPLELWCQPNATHPFLHYCAGQVGARLRIQRGRDLGQRMYHALQLSLVEAPWALVVGADCVSLRNADLDLACATLEHGKDAVLGPAQDGGYVLLGLRRLEKGLFAPMPWGTDKVLSKTRQRLKRFHYAWSELPLRWDADRPGDVRRWLAIRGSSRWRNDRV